MCSFWLFLLCFFVLSIKETKSKCQISLLNWDIGEVRQTKRFYTSSSCHKKWNVYKDISAALRPWRITVRGTNGETELCKTLNEVTKEAENHRKKWSRHFTLSQSLWSDHLREQEKENTNTFLTFDKNIWILHQNLWTNILWTRYKIGAFWIEKK